MSKSNPFILPIIILVSAMFATIHILNLRKVRRHYSVTLNETETRIEDLLKKNNRLQSFLNTDLSQEDIDFIYQYQYNIVPKDCHIIWYNELNDHT